MHITFPASEKVVLVAELQHQFLIFVGADVRDEWGLQALATGVALGRRSGKQVVVDLSEAECFSAGILNELLQPACKGEALPVLAGPLSPAARRRLEVTGTMHLFEVFPALPDAVCPQSDTDPRTRPELMGTSAKPSSFK